MLLTQLHCIVEHPIPASQALEAYQQAARLNPNSAVHDKVRSVGRLARSRQGNGKIAAYAPERRSSGSKAANGT